MEEVKSESVEFRKAGEEIARGMQDTAKNSEKKTISIDPNILIDCIEYTNAVIEGYAAIYKNFQNILWTMRRRGVSPTDAAAATVEIINRASAKAQAMVPHKDPFEELKETPNDDTKEDGSNDVTV